MDVRFITSVAALDARPLPVLPEFAFVGRSNCGKSSLINLFLARNRIAQTSRQPGKTRLLNYFLVQNRYYLVDLPGYGYAKVSKQQRKAWGKLIRAYLDTRDRPVAVFHLMDVRRRPSPEDLEVSRWLRTTDHPFAIAVTKIDKVSHTHRPRRYREIIAELDLPGETPFFPTSARERVGRTEMIGWVEALLEAVATDRD